MADTLMLHRWRIDPAQYERHESRRGRRHAFEQLHPTRTALVVVDLVPFFLDQNQYARGIVPQVNALATKLRTTGGTVAWVLPGGAEPSPQAVEFFGPQVAATYARSGGDGPLRSRLGADLVVEDSDLLVEKTTPSAFFTGGCELHALLGTRNVNTVLITGTVANVCCESTARDASTLGYRTVMVADANAALRDEDLNATLHTFYRSFGDVRPTEELLALLS